MDEEASFPYGEAGLFAFVVAKVAARMVLIRPCDCLASEEDLVVAAFGAHG
jgi:hypothetical protein